MIDMYDIIFVRSRYMIVGADSDINISANAHNPSNVVIEHLRT